MNIENIYKLFQSEFGVVANKFSIIDVPALEARTADNDFIWHPGVYVWYHPEDEVLKVGRHLVNSRKRALEHVRDNTGGVMGKYGKDAATRLLLFNVKSQENNHWVAALEIFFEKNLRPKIRAGRLG